MDFVERIFVPINGIEGTISPTSSRTVVQRPTNYLKRLQLVCAKSQNFQEGIPRNSSDKPLLQSLLGSFRDCVGLDAIFADAGHPSKRSVVLCSLDILPQ